MLVLRVDVHGWGWQGDLCTRVCVRYLQLRGACTHVYGSVFLFLLIPQFTR